jgi:CheY-like chemotaxis protein
MTPFRILVVDDNHLIRRLLDLILEGAGYVPVEAESGEVALAAVRADPPDLCIVDESMPGMSGSELVRALRASGDRRVAQLPVVGISATREGARELLRAGASALVSKPIEERAILVAVARTLFGGRPRGGDPSGLPAA